MLNVSGSSGTWNVTKSYCTCWTMSPTEWALVRRRFARWEAPGEQSDGTSTIETISLAYRNQAVVVSVDSVGPSTIVHSSLIWWPVNPTTQTKAGRGGISVRFQVDGRLANSRSFSSFSWVSNSWALGRSCSTASIVMGRERALILA